MEEFIIYLAESAFCMAVISMFYIIALRRDATFASNRFFLQAGFVFSAVLPLIKLDFAAPAPAIYGGAILPGVVAGGQTATVAQPVAIDIILAVYIFFALFILIRFVWQYFNIRKIARSSEEVFYRGRRIIITDDCLPPFSFFGAVFMPGNIFHSKDFDEIFAHENAHIGHRHYLDILFAQIIVAVQWANPFAWLMKRLLCEVHEYQADGDVIGSGHDPVRYKHMLLSYAGGFRGVEFSSGFGKSIIKERFEMMSKKRSHRKSIIKMALALPIAMLLFAVVACNENSTEELFVYDDISEISDRPEVDQLPEFEGGTAQMRKFIRNNLRFPEEARKNGITGKVYIRFDIEKNGSVTNPVIAHARRLGTEGNLDRLGYGCDEEALRVVGSMPDWKPARHNGEPVKYTTFIPILFGDRQKWRANNPPDKFGRSEKDHEVWVNYSGNQDDSEQEIKMPAYNGDIASDMMKTLKYPPEAQKKNIEGMVLLDLTIDKKGKLADVEIFKSADPLLDAEALRVARTLDKWTPGTRDGKPARITIKLPVKFKLK
jgi:TonB family protein